MAEPKLLPWRKMWDFVSACCQQNGLRATLQVATKEISRLVPCEHSFAILVDAHSGNGGVTVTLEHCNLPLDSLKPYCERYFSKDVARNHISPSTQLYHVDWRDREYRESEIAREYIRGFLRIDCNSGLPFLENLPENSMSFGITRVGSGCISSREESIMLAIRPHLRNLYAMYKRMEALSPASYHAAELAQNCELLSRRESEVAALLCRRLRAAEIATLLFISPRTVETHVLHIYEKLHVANRKELVRRLLGAGSEDDYDSP
jgi:DNA-binding CsgD family transcriptional regulator